MKQSSEWLLVALLCTVTILVGGMGAGAQERAGEKVWDFEDDQEGAPPGGFVFGVTGSGRLGKWVVQIEQNAPSGTHILAQRDADDTDYRFPIAVVDGPVVQDVRLSVNCKPVSGRIDQACGLVFRYQDEQNYYVTRANPLERNIRLYHVVNGRRRQFANWNGAVTAQVWHELRVDARGDSFEIYWDGERVMDAQNDTFAEAGQVGLWTKADSVTYFDDLRVEEISP